MSAPFRPVPDEQMRAFRLALCERLGLDPEMVVADTVRWRVEGDDEIGRVDFTVVLPAQEILDMFNGAAPVAKPGGDPGPPISWTFEDAEVTDRITVQQDIGGPYPQYKRVTLDLMSDGTVRWRDVERD